MCGIFGATGAFVDNTLLDSVSEALWHRGPDDAGLVQLPGVAFVHRRLAIVDLSPRGHQPMSSNDGTVWVTYNGEIYNYPELRSELSKSYSFQSTSDTEVLIAAYQAWGDSFLGRLRGMFAFGLWDDRRQRLLCATDRLSIKPLLFYEASDRLVFGSEVKALAAGGVPLRPNRRMMYDYLRHGLLNHTDETLFEGVRQLRPGTYLVREGEATTIHRYWDLGPDGDLHSAKPEAIERLEALLIESVDIHLRGDVEPALSLSSGLDSAVLKDLIQRAGRHPNLRCFTYCFEEAEYDECSRVKPVLQGTSVRHYATPVHPDGLLGRLDTLVRTLEEPSGGLGIFGYWLNSRTVSEHGIKVLLDGQGADEGFAGYKYYYGARFGDLERAGDLDHMRKELRDFSAVHGKTVEYPSIEFEQLVVRPASATLMRAPDGTAMESDYLTRDFAEEYLEGSVEISTPFDDPVKAAMYRDLFYLKIPKLLRFQDRCAMAWSVEVRVPYLDHVLLEELFRTPTPTLLSEGITKTLLRRIASRYMPVKHRETPKLYVSTPQREWLKSRLRGDVQELIDESALAADGYVDARLLRSQYDAYCASPELGNSFFVWKFINLELWYRNFASGWLAPGHTA
jgi:asparagine synthase (glutamine-hydrolysing)